jgi:hypothetical protein
MARSRTEASVPIGFLYLKALDLVKMISFRTYFQVSSLTGGQVVAQLFQALRNKVACSIPNGVIWNFNWHNPSGSTITLESTQSIKEMSTFNISLRVKAAGV